MKVAIYSHTPIAGAPYLQYQCLKKYTDLQVRHIGHRNYYADGRKFPKDLLLSDPLGREWLRKADVVHIHNYIPPEIEATLSKVRQKIIGTLHSVPRQGNWYRVQQIARRTYTIRQPMQIREYRDFPSLPNLFDVWDYTPDPNKVYTGPLGIVYCPTNKHPDNQRASKGYQTVMPFLERLKKARPEEVTLISHSNMEYYQNLREKRQGHITIDDIVGSTWHLTSIEGGCTGQAVLTSAAKELGFPWVYTTLSSLGEKVNYLLDNREKLAAIAQQTRLWLEDNWDPRKMVAEYVEAYTQ